VAARLSEEEQQQELDETAVTNLVEAFGQALQTVSLQSPAALLSANLQESYGDYVSPELLAEWQNDSSQAPGRLSSSPWPDRIEILHIEKQSESMYVINGNIIEVTSVEVINGGAAARQPITLTVAKTAERWLIEDVTLGAYVEAETIVYTNDEFGFSFLLPMSWEGYTVVKEEWQGDKEGEAVASGPRLSIRHPLWTEPEPRQDIPILVFTLVQWSAMQAGEFHIGAAPIGPSELGRSDEYIFALPARYNYAFPEGFEEVESILQSDPLQVNDRPENSQ